MSKYVSKAGLRQAVHEHLIRAGFSKNGNGYFIDGELSKQRVRDLHASNRLERLKQERSFIRKHGPICIRDFALGKEIDPDSIEPELTEVTSGTHESNLFRIATNLWSIPVSRGFGRRMRFLVRDRQNGKLIGLFALGDPVFNLSARDMWIGWTSDDRRERLVQVMDAYVVGAVPPYSQIIGGKLVAGLMSSSEVKKAYERKYLAQKSIISRKVKRARLVLLTTTSALGRSSLYNRLIIPSGPHFVKIGATRGFGHFHLSGEIFDIMRQYLEQRNHPYASGHRFGMGPNWRLRVVRAALEDVGFDSDDVLNHGIEREIYAVPLARNWKQILLGWQKRLRSCVLSVAEISEFCLQRWVIPRARRDQRFKEFDPKSIMRHVLNAD